jgi:hypothetical protein
MKFNYTIDEAMDWYKRSRTCMCTDCLDVVWQNNPGLMELHKFYSLMTETP